MIKGSPDVNPDISRELMRQFNGVSHREMTQSFDAICDRTLISRVDRLISAFMEIIPDYDRRKTVLEAIQSVHSVLEKTSNPTALQKEIEGCYNALFFLQATNRRSDELEKIYQLQANLTKTLALKSDYPTASLGTSKIISQIGEIYAKRPTERPTAEQINVIVDFQKALGASNPLTNDQIKQLVLFMNTREPCRSITRHVEICQDKTTCTDLLKMFIDRTLQAKEINSTILNEKWDICLFPGLEHIQRMMEAKTDFINVAATLCADKDVHALITLASQISDENVFPNTQINMDGWMSSLGIVREGPETRQALHKKKAEETYQATKAELQQEVDSPAWKENEISRGFMPRSETLTEKVEWLNEQGHPIGPRGVLLGPDGQPQEETASSSNQLFSDGMRRIQFRHKLTHEIVAAKAKLDLRDLGPLTDEQCIQAFDFIAKFQYLLRDKDKDLPLAEWVTFALKAKKAGGDYLNNIRIPDPNNPKEIRLSIDPRVQTAADSLLTHFTPEQRKKMIDIGLTYIFEINREIQHAVLKITK